MAASKEENTRDSRIRESQGAKETQQRKESRGREPQGHTNMQKHLQPASQFIAYALALKFGLTCLWFPICYRFRPLNRLISGAVSNRRQAIEQELRRRAAVMSERFKTSTSDRQRAILASGIARVSARLKAMGRDMTNAANSTTAGDQPTGSGIKYRVLNWARTSMSKFQDAANSNATFTRIMAVMRLSPRRAAVAAAETLVAVKLCSIWYLPLAAHLAGVTHK